MTRNIANWFHEREAELFTIDETPFERHELARLVNDSVDPVQQVQVDGTRYYGVVDYDEHDGWYEYTRWDDMAGTMQIGVCAQCVQQADAADEVARTVGDSTETAHQKFDQHYGDHDVRPEEVETGATLLSGTTVNGNEAIHLGNDGSGSGVDADFVRGGEAVKENTAISGTFSSMSVLKHFASPSSIPDGVGVDSNGCIWNADRWTNDIFKIDQSGSIYVQMNSPPGGPAGLGIDSVDSIWQATQAPCIFEMNQSGSIISQFSAPSSDPGGVGLDSVDSIWHADSTAGTIYQINQAGTVNSQFGSPSSTPNGVGVDSNDCIWNADATADSIYEINTSGSVQSKTQAPNTTPEGVGFDPNDILWHADSSSDEVYAITNFVQL